MKLFLYGLAFLFISSMCISQAQQQDSLSHKQQLKQTLELGKPIEKIMSASEVHHYQIKLNAGEFLRAVVNQRGIDVIVEVYSPGGEEMIKKNWYGSEESEYILLEAKSSGFYLIAIRPSEKNAPTGRYEIRVDEILCADEFAVSVGIDRSKIEGIRKWLNQHTSHIRTVDPADDNFSDLEPIGRAIGNSRVVLLGEQSHGDGTVFLAKTRLIRYLHEKLGFDVVAFESGLYDTYVAWDSIKSGEDPVTAFRRGVFGIWSNSKQLLPLIDYLGARSKTEHPLELSGFDSQFTSKASRERFSFDLLGFLAVHSIDTNLIATGMEARLVLDSLAAKRFNFNEANQRVFLDVWKIVRQKVDKIDHISRDVTLWKQIMKSVEAHAHYIFTNDSSYWAYSNGRDKQMAENLVWLAQERFKGRKIIVWAASMHNSRSLNIVDTQTPGFSYEDYIPFGEHVWQALGTGIYSIGFVASEGSYGPHFIAEPWKLPPVYTVSLEGLWSQTSVDLGFIDFRGLGPNAYLRTRLFSGPFGYFPVVSDWTKIFDGMIYTRVMEKSQRAKR